MDEEENFTIPASEVNILHQEYTEFINLKDNTEIVLSKAMEATEWLNTVFNCIRTSMNRMSPYMKELFIVPVTKSSGKTCEPGNNWAHDEAAAKAATERITAQTTIMEPVPGTGTDDHTRLTQSCVPHNGDRHSLPPTQQNIQENILHTAQSEQSDDSQLQHTRDAHTMYAQATHDECVMTQSRTHHAHDIHMTEGTHLNSQEFVHRRHDLSPINTQHGQNEPTARLGKY
ncbi:hypothetical protein M422DRAFT_249168 [Sphaerobolus stellatus SS14]|nr:hypothetical protein M422DRAFT_249168 [Sphaerobolus stellatus SS14]